MTTTASQVSTYQRFGVYALGVTPDSGGSTGAYHGFTATASTTYTASVNVLGQNNVPYQMYFYDVSASARLGSTTTFTGDANWTSASVSASTDSNTDIRLYIVKNSSASTGTFYIDGVQIEEKAYATTYCDGDQEGCEWLGTDHASTSKRSATSRAGGRVYDVETRTLKLMEVFGSGRPPMQHLTQHRALQIGETYQRTKINPRLLTMMFRVPMTSASSAHGSRKVLVERLKPDDDS